MAAEDDTNDSLLSPSRLLRQPPSVFSQPLLTRVGDEGVPLALDEDNYLSLSETKMTHHCRLLDDTDRSPSSRTKTNHCLHRETKEYLLFYLLPVEVSQELKWVDREAEGEREGHHRLWLPTMSEKTLGEMKFFKFRGFVSF